MSGLNVLKLPVKQTPWNTSYTGPMQSGPSPRVRISPAHSLYTAPAVSRYPSLTTASWLPMNKSLQRRQLSLLLTLWTRLSHTSCQCTQGHNHLYELRSGVTISGHGPSTSRQQLLQRAGSTARPGALGLQQGGVGPCLSQEGTVCRWKA